MKTYYITIPVDTVLPDNDDIKIYKTKEELLKNLAELRYSQFGKDIQKSIVEMINWDYTKIQLYYKNYDYILIKVNI